MTKHDLKEMMNLGAELGAAKAENDRLRGLLEAALYYVPSNKSELRTLIDNALSQKAEPDCVACEGRPAACNNPCALCGKQAEPTDTYTAVDMINQSAQAFRDGQAAVEQAPAQDEQPAVFWVLFDATGPERFIKKDVSDGTLAFFDSEDEAQRAKRRHPGTDYKRVEYYRAPIAQTVPQPEQSEELAWEVLKAATDILDRRAAPHAWVSQAWAAGSKVITSRRAALSAQGQSNGDS